MPSGSPWPLRFRLVAMSIGMLAGLGSRGMAGRGLSLRVGTGEAQMLSHELRGAETPCRQVVRALGGRVRATRLVATESTRLTAVLEIDSPGGLVERPAAPGQPLAAAPRLGRPLPAAKRLVASDGASDAVLSGRVVTFLDALEVQRLDAGSPARPDTGCRPPSGGSAHA
jgi:hypothetical protein